MEDDKKSNNNVNIFSVSSYEPKHVVSNSISIDMHSEEVVEQSQTRSSSSILQICKKFGEETSMHGLKHTVNHNSRWWKQFVWTVLLLGSATFASRNLYFTVDEYLQFPVSTTTTLVNTNETMFPAVTICNLNPYQASKMKLFLNLFYEPLKDQPEREEMFRLIFEMCKNPDPGLIMAIVCQMQSLDVMHELQDMLVKCQVSSLFCDYSNFTAFPHRHYGTCFTLNVTSLLNTHVLRAGIGSGANLELNIQHEEYLPFTKEVGLKVVIHPPDTMPFPYENGISVSTGVITNIAIRKVRIQRLGYPWGKCIDPKDTDETLNIYSKYGFGYSQDACYKTCHQQAVIQNCNCCDSNIPCPRNSYDTTLPAHKRCNESDANIITCMMVARYTYLSGINLPCFGKCLPSCEQIIYRTSYSIASMPIDSKRYPYVDNFSKLPNGSFIDNIMDNLSIVKLGIYFETLQEETIVSSPTYTWFKLLSDIGGTLGLWLGFSVITAVEFLELSWDVAGRTISLLRGKDRNKKE